MIFGGSHEKTMTLNPPCQPHCKVAGWGCSEAVGHPVGDGRAIREPGFHSVGVYVVAEGKQFLRVIMVEILISFHLNLKKFRREPSWSNPYPDWLQSYFQNWNSLFQLSILLRFTRFLANIPVRSRFPKFILPSWQTFLQQHPRGITEKTKLSRCEM